MGIRRKIGWAACVVVLSLASGGTSDAARPDATSTAEAPRTRSKLEVDVTVKYERDGRTAVLQPGDVLTGDDNYRVIFEPKRDSYVYVYQVSADRIDAIFPNPDYSTASNPVAAKIVYSVPPEGRWLHLDRERGTENIIVVAADAPFPDPKMVALRLLSASGAEKAKALQVPKPGSEPVFSYQLTFEHR